SSAEWSLAYETANWKAFWAETSRGEGPAAGSSKGWWTTGAGDGTGAGEPPDMTSVPARRTSVTPIPASTARGAFEGPGGGFDDRTWVEELVGPRGWATSFGDEDF